MNKRNEATRKTERILSLLGEMYNLVGNLPDTRTPATLPTDTGGIVDYGEKVSQDETYWITVQETSDKCGLFRDELRDLLRYFIPS